MDRLASSVARTFSKFVPLPSVYFGGRLILIHSIPNLVLSYGGCECCPNGSARDCGAAHVVVRHAFLPRWADLGDCAKNLHQNRLSISLSACASDIVVRVSTT